MTYKDSLDMDAILELDGKLRACAQLLIYRYRDECVYMGQKSILDFPYYDEIDVFMEHFEALYRRRHPKEPERAITERVIRSSDSLMEIVACLIEKKIPCGFSIMLPVILYTLTLNYCFNKSSKQKSEYRANKLRSMKEEIRARSDKRDFTNYIPEYDIHRRSLCTIVRDISSEDSAAYYTFMKHGEGLSEMAKMIEDTLRGLKSDVKEGFLSRVNDDLNLALSLWKNRSDVVYFEESAYIGQFLRDIFSDNRFGLDPLDTIIAMYVVNEMDQVLMRTGIMGNLPVEVFIDDATENGLLKWHCQSETLAEAGNVYERYVAYCEKKCEGFLTAVQEMKNGNQQPLQERTARLVGEEYEEESVEKAFMECYTDLKETFSFTKDDVQLLMDFYLNEEGLGTGMQLRHLSLLYVKEMASKLMSGKFAAGYRKPKKVFLDTVVYGIWFQSTSRFFRNIDIHALWSDHFKKIDKSEKPESENQEQ